MDVWSDKKRQNQERTHPRNDEGSAGVLEDNGEKSDMVWARREDGRGSRSEESDDESDTGERKRGTPKTRWKDVCKRDMQTVGLREGDEGDRAYWKEMINNHSGAPDDGKSQRKRRRWISHYLYIFVIQVQSGYLSTPLTIS